MRNRFLILFLVAATLVACNSDSMISDDFNETAEKKQNSFPFKAVKMAGTYEFGEDVETSIENCAGLGLNAEGEGNVAHLGLTTVLEEWCWNGFPFDKGTRKVTFTAANGDELWGEMNDPVDYFENPDYDPNGNFAIFREVVTIVGGTGRFENAQGTITQTVDTTPDASQTPIQGFGTFTYSAEGTISY